MSKEYMDLIPVINEEYSWQLRGSDKVIVNVIHKGFYNSFAVKYLNKSEESEIELDSYGSYVWQKIDGKKKIRDIITEIITDLGEERNLAEKRAALFFEMLRMHRLIRLVRPDRVEIT